ncbi:MAG: ABC transporter ATP-binding protein [Betaproteobacteria bacterium]|nr:ABC transporter ATP-binding protein [Betaproteobacteria bacterium]
MTLILDLVHDAPALDFRSEIPEGQITALVGPSGSGKTSILRAVAGLLRTKQAHVALGGDIWDDASTHLPTRERPIGFVPQQYGLFPHLTASGNVGVALMHLPSAERLARAEECLALAHVAGLENRYPRELSGGQKQRVALARAIARAPKLLLLDEPFSAVDRSTRKRLYLELRRLHEQLRTTVLLVTHDLDEAAQLASHLILLHHGRLLQTGPTGEVLRRPRSVAAARLLDFPNLFDGHLDAAPPGRKALLRWGPHTLRANAGDTPSGSVRWAIQSGDVLLVAPDKPWGGHLQNPVAARVSEVLELGMDALVWLEPEGLPATRLQMRLPARTLERHRVAVGAALTVCLRPGDIMLLADSGRR